MARKDVELVIRAKDEAAKAINSITKAINSLTEGQDTLVKGAAKSETAMSRLGGAFDQLTKSVRGGSVGDQIARSFGTATKAVERLESAVASGSAELADLGRRHAEAAQEAARLAAATLQAAAAVKQEAATLEQSKKALADRSAALRQATAEKERLAAADLRQTKQIADAEARLAKSTARYDEIAAGVAKVANPAQALTDKLARAAATVAAQTDKLAGLKTAQDATRVSMEAMSATEAQLSKNVEITTTGLQRQAQVSEQTRQEHTQLQTAARTTAQQERALASEVENASERLAAQKGALASTAVDLTKLSATAAQANASMSQLATGATKILRTELDAGRKTLIDTRKAWADQEAAVKSLAQSMDIIGPPTRAQAEALTQARAASQLAVKEYATQRGELTQLGAILRETGGDIDVLRDRQQRFGAVQADTADRVRKLKAELKESRDAIVALGNATQQTGSVVNSLKTQVQATPRAPVDALSDAYKKLHGETRQAMSFTQRLRGEVLSLVAAYGGLFGAINVLSQSIKAFQQLEAAQSRLNVVFNGDPVKSAEELDFLRRNADRLGVSFGDLAGEYSKFAIATQGTVLQGEQTRKIFLSVAEAGRVNKTSAEDMKGVFVALTQIVSKGSVQMEELRQQLGDRLPGALQLMAAGLGVTTGELIKMMEQGQVTSSALVGFAQELDKRFGSQLTAALQSTSAEMGKFQNATFQALIAFGQAGFITSFTNLLKTLTETLKSAEFQSFANRLSAGIASLTDFVAGLVRHFDLVAIAIGAVLGLKIAPFFAAITLSIQGIIPALAGASIAFAAAQQAAIATATATAATGAAVSSVTLAYVGLRAALISLLATPGGAIAIAAIGAGIALWATSADDATKAINAHNKAVDDLKSTYERTAGATKEWADEVRKVSLLQLMDQLDKVREALLEIRKEASKPTNLNKVSEQVGQLVDAFKSGRILADDFKKQLDLLGQANPQVSRQLFTSLIELADKAIPLEQKIKELTARMVLYADPANRVALATLNIGKAIDDGTAATIAGTERLKRYIEAVEKLKEFIPSLSDELKRLKDLAAIDTAYLAAIKSAQGIQEVTEAARLRERGIAAVNASEFDEAVKNIGKFSDAVEASAALLRKRENFIPQPKPDNDGVLRTGFGSDTFQLADGIVRKVVAGITVSREDANRDLYRRIGEFMEVVKGQIGKDTFSSFNPAQQAVLTSIAYNYGKLPERILDAVKGRNTEEIAGAIERLAGDNSGINRGRRNEEAAIFRSKAGDEAVDADVVKQREKLAAEEKKKREEQEKYLKDQKESIAQGQFELSIAQKTLLEKEIAKEVRDAELAAQKVGLELSKEQREEIIRITTEKFKQKSIDAEEAKEKKKATDEEEKVNNLIAARGSLEEQQRIARANGDTTKFADTKKQIQDINATLIDTIDSSIKLWEAVGGTAAQAAIERLKLARLEAQGFSADAKIGLVDWKRVGDLFASGLANAVDKFAAAVAEGKKVGEAAREAFLSFASDFLRAIAQMIIKQLALNLLRSLFPGTFGAGHTGGLVGSSRIGSGNATRQLDPGIFSAAMRYHGGGIVGLRPSEVPAILEKNEEVLTRDDPRHMLNGGLAGAQAAPAPIFQPRIINAIDPGSFVSEGSKTKQGERALINFMSANSSAIKRVLGV